MAIVFKQGAHRFAYFLIVINNEDDRRLRNISRFVEGLPDAALLRDGFSAAAARCLE